MSHEQAWSRLPDLLFDRDEPELLAHLSGCHDCQRQLFRLERVDRLLREAAAAERREQRRWPHVVTVALALLAAAALALVAGAGKQGAGQALTLRSLAGLTIGHARLVSADRRNISVQLVTNGLPTRRGLTYLLWAQAATSPPRLVGRFMVSPTGSCRASFNLPADRRWTRLWITPPTLPETVLAET